MIDATTAGALARIAQRANDLLHAYQGGFEPLSSDATARGVATARNLDPLSVVAPEGTYFVARDARGRPVLSRDGGFRFADGVLQTADGYAALGIGGDARTLRVLRIDAVDVALGRVSDARIEQDGSVAYTRSGVDPRTGERRTERVVAGRLALARLPAGTLPERAGPTHVVPPHGVTPVLGRPADGNFAALTTFARDLGRLDVAAGLQRLQEAYLSFDALLSARHARGGVDKTTMDLVK